MPQVMSRIKPMHGPVVPAPNWKAAGVTPDGRQLWTETYKTNKSIPDYPEMTNEEVLEQLALPSQQRKWKGERRWKKNPINAEPLVPMDRRNIVEVSRLFFTESEGNFNQRKVFWVAPTAAELALAEREGRKAAVLAALAEGLVDSQLSTDEIIARLTASGPILTREQYEETYGEQAQEVIVPEPSDDPAAITGPKDGVEYPIKLAKGRWEFSNGTSLKCTEEEAISLEIEVQEARAAAAENPEF